MIARIYQPARNAMQSGQGKTKNWVMEYETDAPRSVDPLMGWTSSGDMNSQVKLTFETKDAAIAYATSKGIAYNVLEPKERKHNVRVNGYADNFATSRKTVWTH